MRKLADVKIKLGELVVEAYPTLIKCVTSLIPEYSRLVLPGDFVILSKRQVSHLSR